MSFLGAIIAFVLGVVVSFANYKINDRILKVKPDLVAAGTVVRQLFNVGYLAAVYFIVPHTPFSMILALVGAVLGLTLAMFYFTYCLVRIMDKSKKTDDADKTGEDDNIAK